MSITPFDEFALGRAMHRCKLKELPTPSGDPDGYRSSGDMICQTCGQEYRYHPMDWRVLSYQDRPYLNILCNGERVKL